MKKSIAFWALSLLIFCFFACDLQVPSAVHITGTPDVHFAADLDINEKLMGIMGDFFQSNDDPNTKYINCPNTEIKTFIIHMTLMEGEIDQDNPSMLSLIKTEIDLGNDYIANNTEYLFPDSAGSYKDMTLSELDFSFIENFSFEPSEVRIYRSGSEFANLLSIELMLEDGSKIPVGVNSASGLPLDGSDYSGKSLPKNGEIFPLHFDGNEMQIKYRIFIAKDTVIGKNVDLDKTDIYLEMAILVPMVLIAGSGGAVFELPGIFPDRDLFGRENQDDEGSINKFIDKFGFEIELNQNPFEKAVIKIKSGDDFEFTSDFNGKSLSLDIDENRMHFINNSWPFKPRIFMQFAQGGKLVIPNGFRATRLGFNARLNYVTDI